MVYHIEQRRHRHRLCTVEVHNVFLFSPSNRPSTPMIPLWPFQMVLSPRSASTDLDSTADDDKFRRPESSSAQGRDVLLIDSGQLLSCIDSAPAENNASDEISRLLTSRSVHHDPCDHLRSRLLVNVTFPDVTWTAPPTELAGTLAFFRANGMNGDNFVVSSNRGSDPCNGGHGADSCWEVMASTGTGNNQRRPLLQIDRKGNGCRNDGRVQYLRAAGGEDGNNTERRQAWVRLEEFIKATAAIEVGPRPRVGDIWTPAGSISERLFRGVPEVRMVLVFLLGMVGPCQTHACLECASKGCRFVGKNIFIPTFSGEETKEGYK